jgi:hypothetical protein
LLLQLSLQHNVSHDRRLGEDKQILALAESGTINHLLS